ncbi:MAG: gamma-glutamyltransferase [Arthrobacter sp.]|uniref:gamma-glutamyltransferase n=1 Tax=Arthrobacter sp. TaxID=1667 RepID=UPI003486EC95
MPRKTAGLRWHLAAALLLALAGCSAPAPPANPPAPAPAPPSSASSAPGSGSAGSAGSPAARTPPSRTPATPAPSSGPGETLLRDHAVSAAHPAAVRAGMEILDAGGNAADAAVATAFAVAVVEPFASGIGGGGSAVLAEAGAEPQAYDYREVVARNGIIPASGTGVPGFVAGMADIHERHGRLPWREVLAPAIRLADGGFPVSAFLAQRMRSDSGPAALEGMPHFASPGGAPLGEGDRLVQRDLAATMEVLAVEGPDAFYTGSLVRKLTRVDGIDAGSLADYEPERVRPVRGAFGDYEVVSVAPALPGAALVQMLQIAEALDVEAAEPGSARYVDRLAAAWEIADAGVTRHFGDPRFVDVPVGRLTDPAANARLARGTAAADGGASAKGAAGTGIGGATAGREIVAGNTTHLTVVDSGGFTVSMTNTITNFWGGDGAENVGGFFLNNQLSRFASLDTPNNRPGPGRKSVSWAAPSLVLDSRGRVVVGLGSPGGHQIPNILAGVLVPWALQGASLQEAVDAPRHHLQDGVLALEREPAADVARLARARGWETRVTERRDAVFGSVQALEIDYAARSVTGADDARREAGHDVGQPGL